MPFLRGSGKGKYKFYSKSGLTLTTATQDLGPIDVKAYDYMRSILVTVSCSAAGGITSGTLAADGPFNVLTNVAVNHAARMVEVFRRHGMTIAAPPAR